MLRVKGGATDKGLDHILMVLWDIQRSKPYPNGAVGYPKV